MGVSASLAPWIAVGVFIVGQLSMWALEQVKEARAAKRRYVEEAYRALLELAERLHDESLGLLSNSPLPAERRIAVQNAANRLRMHIDFLTAPALNDEFGKLDDARRKFEASLNRITPPNLPPPERLRKEFAVAFDRLQIHLQDELRKIQNSPPFARLD